jgi:hypothetical protein
VSNSFFLPATSISHTSTLNAERRQLSIAAARMAADLVDRPSSSDRAGAAPDPHVLRAYEACQAGQMISLSRSAGPGATGRLYRTSLMSERRAGAASRG